MVENADKIVTGQHENSDVKELVTNSWGNRNSEFRWWTKEVLHDSNCVQLEQQHLA